MHYITQSSLISLTSFHIHVHRWLRRQGRFYDLAVGGAMIKELVLTRVYIVQSAYSSIGYGHWTFIKTYFSKHIYLWLEKIYLDLNLPSLLSHLTSVVKTISVVISSPKFFVIAETWSLSKFAATQLPQNDHRMSEEYFRNRQQCFSMILWLFCDNTLLLVTFIMKVIRL